MADQPARVERALSALRQDVWTDLQHRRVGKRLEEAVSKPAGPNRAPWFAVAAMACVLLVGALLARSAYNAPPIATTGTSIGSTAAEMRAILADGSEVQVARGGRVQVVSDRLEETRVEVVAGYAEFEVKKRPNRAFIASVRGVEVRVVGTQFATELDTSRPPGLVRVVVRRGVVEVSRPGGGPPLRVAAGESVEVPLEPVEEPAPAKAEPPAPEGQAPAEPAVSAGTPATPTAPPPPATPHVDASKLFAAAQAARGAGDIDGAVRSYAALVKQFPTDERVGVAALELGRLRMDAQHAYPAAADAFRKAIAGAPNEGVREDALARLVEVLDAMNDRAGCAKEQARYLQRYPQGMHASVVEARCRR